MRNDDVGGFEEQERAERERLRSAVLAAVAECGFEETTVSFVCDLAGCSCQAFHHHYDDLTACLKDGCAGAVESSRTATISGWLGARGWRRRLHAACAALLGHVDANADAARAVLIESLGAGPPLTDHLRETVSGFERAVTMAFQLHPEGFPSSRQTPRAITGGVSRMIRMRLLDGRGSPSVAEELEDWICCYRSSDVCRIRPARPMRRGLQGPLRRGSLGPQGSWARADLGRTGPAWAGSLSREASGGVEGEGGAGRASRRTLFPGEGERERVLEALAHAMLQDGRQTLEDETVARFAGIEVADLRRRHGGVDGCLSDLLDGFLSESEAVLGQASRRAGSWPEAVRLGVVAFLRLLDVSPPLSRLLMLRLSLVPSFAAERRDAISESLMGFVCEGAPPPRHAPALLGDLLPGSISEMLDWALIFGGPKAMPGLADQVSFVLLAPYLGAEQAVDAIVASAEAERLGGSPG